MLHLQIIVMLYMWVCNGIVFVVTSLLDTVFLLLLSFSDALPRYVVLAFSAIAK